jgi:hypothetical protein
MAEFLIVSLDKGDVTRRLAADAVWRCENRLNSLVGKMRYARNTRSGITVTGGILTAVGALTTAIFAAVAASKDGADKGLNVAAVVSGSITAASSITTLVGTQIEDPSNLKGLYEGSLMHYNSAYGHLLDLDATVDTEAWNSLYHKALRELNECAREEVVAKNAPAGDIKVPTNQPGGDGASAPANKARGESSGPSPLEKPGAAAKPSAPPASTGPQLAAP